MKIIGEINGSDWRLIRDMAGSSVNGYETNGKLSVLDLSEAKIVEGGGYYYTGRVAWSDFLLRIILLMIVWGKLPFIIAVV